VEILISDNSEDHETADLIEKALDHGLMTGNRLRFKYWRNQPPTGMVENWNILASQATGEYLMWLHDDDFLLPRALSVIMSSLRESNAAMRVFSCQVVDERERVMRRGGKHRNASLVPAEALANLFRHSSWIRFPGVVVRREAFNSVGLFDPCWGDLADLDLWSRLVAKFGLVTSEKITAAYTIHQKQATHRMFQAETLRQIQRMGQRFVEAGQLPESKLREALQYFFWRFVLAGSMRALMKGDMAEMRRILELRDEPPTKDFSCPKRWRALLWCFGLISQANRRKNFHLEVKM
jgi:GT2 family glycosyltransferase